MPSFQDSAFIFFLALLLFGPKKLPELARQLGKLMGEFRRASSEFRMQMEEELRVSEQAENQKKIAAIEAAAPVAPALSSGTDTETAEPTPEQIAASIPDPLDEHPHTAPGLAPAAPEPLPIASSGELHMMPPATGLPIGREAHAGNGNRSTDIAPVLQSIPQSIPQEGPTSSTDEDPHTSSFAPVETTQHG